MELTHNPVALPGSCYFCPGSVRPWYIDTQCQVEYHGAMYICNECLTHMAHLAGYVTPEEAEDLKINLAFAQKNEYELHVQVDALEKAINELTRAGYPSGGADLRAYHVDVVSPQVGISDTYRTEEELGVGEGETSESPPDEDVAGLRTNQQSTEYIPVYR